jgi:hypothetical protein
MKKFPVLRALLELGRPFRDLLSKKICPVNFHLKKIKTLGLDPDPDWIRIQQLLDPEPNSDEYEFKTLLQTHKYLYSHTYTFSLTLQHPFPLPVSISCHTHTGQYTDNLGSFLGLPTLALFPFSVREGILFV